MKELASDIRSIIEYALTNAVRSVDFCRVRMYWQIGRRIVEEKQRGQARGRVWQRPDKESRQRDRT